MTTRPSSPTGCQTPAARLRTTPLTGPRAPARPRVEARYSASPLCTIDENALAPSRFLDPATRRLAFRDGAGRVNLHLCERSLKIFDPQRDDDVHRTTLSSWARHAARALAQRPADEGRTLDELVEDEENEREALPLSLRKPRRTPCETTVHLTPAQPAAAASDDDDDASSASSSARLAKGTVSLQRRLFRAPRLGDEPSIDAHYLGQLRAPRRSPSLGSDDDVWEVKEILSEASGRFLIRWEGFGPEDDTWEPEENVAPALVADYRRAAALRQASRGTDYMRGQTRMLWCATCAEHQPSDSFSASQRRLEAANRCCLFHHYRICTGVAPSTPDAHLAPRKRSRPEAGATLAPKRQARMLTAESAMGTRRADREVAQRRLYGF